MSKLSGHLIALESTKIEDLIDCTARHYFDGGRTNQVIFSQLVGCITGTILNSLHTGDLDWYTSSKLKALITRVLLVEDVGLLRQLAPSTNDWHDVCYHSRKLSNHEVFGLCNNLLYKTIDNDFRFWKILLFGLLLHPIDTIAYQQHIFSEHLSLIYRQRLYGSIGPIGEVSHDKLCIKQWYRSIVYYCSIEKMDTSSWLDYTTNHLTFASLLACLLLTIRTSSSPELVKCSNILLHDINSSLCSKQHYLFI